MFEGIKKLLPGYSISFSKSGFILKKFFKIKLDDNNKFDNNHDEEIVLEELIENSVRLQLRADVAVGMFFVRVVLAGTKHL